MKTPILYIVLPCYNEQECLKEITKQLKKKLKELEKNKKIHTKSRIVFIDDGSKDKTWEIISKFKKPVIGIKLAHNRGHQNALLAGLMYAKNHADIVISMDADLQDDINAIDSFIDKFNEGYEIVYGVRSNRQKDPAFKKHLAQNFYKTMNKLGVEMAYNSADYRLMSKRALEELAKYQEINLFLRGIVPTIGLKSTTVEYTRGERFAGKSKYSSKKMLGLAWDGITSFSIRPIRFIMTIGIIVSIISLIVLVYSVVMKIIGQTVDGWTFIICSIWIIGGVQMISIGLVGEYIGKIYSEVKRRPRYIIEKIVGE